MIIDTLIPNFKYSKYKYLEGKRFGRLVISKAWSFAYNSMVTVKADCDCGTKDKEYLLNSLKKGSIKSCGCFHSETAKIIGENNIKHGMHGAPEYAAYHDAKHRCNNINDIKYKDYGGRGIKFLFNSFEEFYKEIGDRPNSEYSIDRIENNGHYEKGNVKWSTKSEQRNNRRKCL